MTVGIAIERALAPLDRLRARTLKKLGPIAIPFVRDRDLRVTAIGLTSVAFAAVGAALFPLLLLALGPLLLGVPHLLSDLRYLVFGPALHRRMPLMLALALPLLFSYATNGILPLAVGPALVALLARAPLRRRLVVGGAWCAVPLAFWLHPLPSMITLIHLHNVVAVAIWWWWRPGRPAMQFAVPLAALGAGALLLLEPPEIWPDAGVGPLSARYHLALLGLDSAGALYALRVFAFAQALHYAVWLRLVPEDDRARPTPRPFAASFRALRVDLGMPLVALGVALWIGILVDAFVDLAGAHGAYLKVARFHGPLELAILALWTVEGRTRA